MHVAYLCADPGVPVFGTKGSSVHVQEIVRAWRDAGADVTVYCTRRGTDRPADLADLDVVEIPPLRGPRHRPERALQDAALALADAGPARRLRACSTRRYSLFSPALSLVARPWRPVRARSQCTPHRGAAAVPPAAGREERPKRSCAATPAGATSWPASRSPWSAGCAAGCPRPGPCWHRTASTSNASLPRRPGRRHPGHLTVAFVGTLKPWHGVPALLHAVALANTRPPTRTGVDGADHRRRPRPGRPRTPRQPAGRGRRSSPAPLPPAPCPACCRNATPPPPPTPPKHAGRDDYFSPLKVYEYMAAAMPIIATSVGQIPSIVEDGRTGLLVPRRGLRASPPPSPASAASRPCGQAWGTRPGRDAVEPLQLERRTFPHHRGAAGRTEGGIAMSTTSRHAGGRGAPGREPKPESGLRRTLRCVRPHLRGTGC